MSFRRKKYKYKRAVEYICNYIDNEWLDAIGTDGTRLSIPSKLVKSEIFPDDVLCISVKRDKVKSDKRHRGEYFCPIIEAPALFEGITHHNRHAGSMPYWHQARRSKSKIVAFPKPPACLMEPSHSNPSRIKKPKRHKKWILRRRLYCIE